MPPVRLRLAPICDVACITTFVLIGGRTHEVTEDIGWFVGVMWPLCIGFFGVALLSRLYVRDRGVWLALAVTLLGGVAVTQMLRGAFTHHPWISVFTAIALGYLSLTMFGWRLVATLVARRRAAAAG
ncbi:MAG: DUF3054 family protein [Acidimicrobiia bacterium]